MNCLHHLSHLGGRGPESGPRLTAGQEMPRG
jgi:hypothetical protein